MQIKHKNSLCINTPVGLLDTSSGGCGLASGLCGQLLSGCLAAGGLAGCLLGASHLTVLLLAESNDAKGFSSQGSSCSISITSVR